MLTDGISFLGASSAENFSVITGSTLPVTGNNLGELFYLTSGATPGLYVYKSTGWTVVGSGSGGGGGTWGSITGTLSAQTDLQAALGSISTSVTTVSNASEKLANRGVASGYAPLDGSAVVPIVYIGTGTKNGASFLSGAGTFVPILSATSLDIAFTNLGVMAVGRVFMFVANRAYRLPQNLTASVGKVTVNPTGQRTIAIHKIDGAGTDTTIGNVIINTAGIVSFTFAAAVDFAIGDVLYFQNLVADAAMTDVSVTITAMVI